MRQDLVSVSAWTRTWRWSVVLLAAILAVSYPAGIADAAGMPTSLGHSLAYGDFDADGLFDVAAGMPGADASGVEDAGAVAVFYGNGAEAYFHQDTPDVPDKNEKGDRFGFSLDGLEVNNDGYDDLAIGVPYENVEGKLNAGAVVILYGSASGLVTDNAQLIHQGTPGVPGSNEKNDRFGWSLGGAQKVDGAIDVYGDLAVGAPYEDVRSVVDAGLVTILRGSATGLTGVGGRVIHQNSPGVPSSNEKGDLFGYSILPLGWGLIVGQPGEDISGIPNAGAITIFQHFSGPKARVVHQNTAGVPGKNEKGDRFGAVLPPSLPDQFNGYMDVNGDGYEDFAVGVPDEDIGGKVDPGAVVVLYGSAESGIGTHYASRGTIFHQDKAGVPGVNKSGDRFGASIAFGYYPYYPFGSAMDMAVGVPGKDIGKQTDAGSVVVFRTSPNGITASGSEALNQNHLDNGRAEPNDRFGSSVLFWFFETHEDDPGLQPDLVVGAPGENGGKGEIDWILYFDASGGAIAGPSDTTRTASETTE